MADFTVDPDLLRELATGLRRKAGAAQQMSARTRGMPAGAWGRLGDEYGLPDLYTEVRDQAGVCLARIDDFLDATAESLAATAGHYEEHDAAMARRFDRIARGDGEWSDPASEPRSAR